jgi:hypothetical protein
MNDIDYYRRQMALYTEAMSQAITISGRQFLEMDVIIIHRPDKLSPKKAVMTHKMDMTK